MRAWLARARRSLPGWVATPADIVIETVHRYHDDGCGTHAAAIAYYAIFSLIPLGLVILSIAGLVVDRRSIVDFVFDQVPLQQSQFQNVDRIVARAQDISIAGISVGALLLLWSGSSVFGAVRRGLSASSERGDGRPFWRGKLVDLALIPAVGTLLVLSVVLTAAAQGIIERAGHIGPFELGANAALQVLSYVLPALVTLATFALLYRFVPSQRPDWAQAMNSALFASLAFELAKNVAAIAFGQLEFEKETAIYAGFGTALAFLLWMYVSASIILLGAEFAEAIEAWSVDREERWEGSVAALAAGLQGPREPRPHRVYRRL